MTNERAIELLKRISDSQFDGIHGDERREALEMAVRALEGDGDTISRKQVLNASHFVACWDGVEHFSLEVVDADFIQKLPSVQPTQTNADSTQTNTLDCVSRQQAIVTAVRAAIDWHRLANPQYSIAYCIGEAMRQLPPTQPERKRGHYIKGKNGEWYCSECRRIDDKYSVANFCWYCGARMDGESDV